MEVMKNQVCHEETWIEIKKTNKVKKFDNKKARFDDRDRGIFFNINSIYRYPYVCSNFLIFRVSSQPIRWKK